MVKRNDENVTLSMETLLNEPDFFIDEYFARFVNQVDIQAEHKMLNKLSTERELVAIHMERELLLKAIDECKETCKIAVRETFNQDLERIEVSQEEEALHEVVSIFTGFNNYVYVDDVNNNNNNKLNLKITTENLGLFGFVFNGHLTQASLKYLDDDDEDEQTLCLMSKSIDRICPNAFRKRDDVKRLYLSDNQISNLHSRTFSYMKNSLQILKLSYNNLGVEFEANAAAVFSDLIHLKSLYLSYNKLQHIRPEMFQSLTKLEYLCLSDNIITTVNFGTGGCHSLHVLDLSNNKIELLINDTFKDLVHLKKLNLSRNCLESLDPNIFQNLVKLEYLNLSYNRLSVINGFKLPSLQMLLLNNNRIRVCNGRLMLSEGNALAELYLQCNEIESISGDYLAHLDSLQKLNLYVNNLMSLNDHMFSHLSQLKILTLSKNKIYTIESNAFVQLKALQDLNLAYNELETCDFRGLAGLNQLNMANNKLRFVHFSDLRDLEYLSLDQNKLSSLKKSVFSSLTKLRQLLISDNELEHFEVDGLNFLEKLDLSGNRLTSISQELLKRPTLKHLDVSRNLDLARSNIN